MKPTSPLQLARLLDQVSGHYPNGIPVSALVSRESVNVEVSPRYQFFIVEERELSPVTSALMDGIASKGLRLSRDEYRVSFIAESDVVHEITKCASERVIVFHSSSREIPVERSFGEPVLLTHSLEQLANDASLKKELWRSLQTFLTPA